MVTTEQQQQAEAAHKHGGDQFDCPLFAMLDPMMQQESREKPHLWQYIHDLPIQEIGVPQYVPKLDKSHEELTRPNVVYPAGKGIFIHIMPDENDARDFYNTIEPNRVPNLNRLSNDVDMRLVDHVDELKTGETEEEKIEILLGVVDKIVEVNDSVKGRLPKLFGRGNGNGKIRVSPHEMVALKYVMVRDKLGMGPLEPLVLDPNIEDISCSGTGPLFVEHKAFGGLKASVTFVTCSTRPRNWTPSSSSSPRRSAAPSLSASPS